MRPEHDLSIVIPATDEPSTLARAVASVNAAIGPRDEVIVVAEGAGPAAARNAGGQRARGSILVFVDADVELHVDALERVRSAFGADPELTALFGSYDDAPAARGTVSRFRNLLHHHVHQESPGAAKTFWAGLGAVRREAFLAAGGFDSASYPAAMVEDIDLGMRLSAAGARIRLDPRVRARHLKRWTLGSMVRTDLERRGVPWVRMLIARRDLSPSLNLRWRHRATALAYSTAAAVTVVQLFAVTAVLVAVAIALNLRFYALLFRCGGLWVGAAGVPLHWVHHMTAVAAVPIGATSHVLQTIARREASPRRPAAELVP